MNYGPLLFLGIFITMAVTWAGIILVPFRQLNQQVPALVKETGQLYPQQAPGQAGQGLEVYRANGCVACHSQQVRGTPADLARWGQRLSVSADYLYVNPVLIGNQRIGPDLANVGTRQPNLQWHLLHLYNPRITVPQSTMPRYPYLFEKRRMSRVPSPNALALPSAFAPEKGYEIVPKPEALALATYLTSLHVGASLFEAPIPRPNTNSTAQAPTGTNAPVTVGTNAPVQNTNSSAK